MYKCLFIISLLFSLFSLSLQAETINISQFSNKSLADWQHKSFKEYTDYQILMQNKQAVLQAKSTAVASSLYKEVAVDLRKTPYLNWSWRVDKKLAITNEQSKAGDDFSARIYLIVKGRWFWQTKAMNYVWANHSPKNTSWANPFAGKNVMMLAIRSNNDNSQQWYTEKRNVLQDLQQYFAEDITQIDAVAIMTDTDNAGGSALSYYADIYFSED